MPEYATSPIVQLQAPAGDRVAPLLTGTARGWLVGLCMAATAASLWQVTASNGANGALLTIVLHAIVAISAWSDVTTRRIPNVLTYPAIVLGLVVSLMAAPLELAGLGIVNQWTGTPGTLDAVLGLSVCAGIGIAGFTARGLGGGDVKLLACVGVLLGFKSACGVLANTLCVAMLFAVVNYLTRGGLLGRVQHIAASVMYMLYTRRHMPLAVFEPTQMPFALAVFGGVLLAPWWSASQWIDWGWAWAIN